MNTYRVVIDYATEWEGWSRAEVTIHTESSAEALDAAEIWLRENYPEAEKHKMEIME